MTTTTNVYPLTGTARYTCADCGAVFYDSTQPNPARLVPTVEGDYALICPRCARDAQTPRSYFPAYTRPGDFGTNGVGFLRELGITPSEGGEDAQDSRVVVGRGSSRDH